MNESLLEGLRVLDFSRVLAGPLCAQYLADLGADVLKVESVDHGDDMRGWPPFMQSVDGTRSTATSYLAWNRNKRDIALDLKAPESKEIVAQLIRRADVVITSFGPGASARLGLDADSVRAIDPRIIHCSISGYGSVGPMRKGKGYDMILQAFCGMMSVTGEEGGGPVRTPFSPIDQGTGMHALSGILAALHARHRTGKGASIEVSLFDTGAAFLATMLQNYWERGTETERQGVGHESLCPYEAFETADRPIILGVANDKMWRSFCAMSGLEALAEDPKFATSGKRVSNRHECVAIVQAALAKEKRDHWIERLEAAGIPCSPLHKLGELSEHPHTRASGMLFDYAHPAFGQVNAIALPIRIDGERARVRRHAPERGEHTAEVLGELGYGPDEIGVLLKKGVARTSED